MVNTSNYSWHIIRDEKFLAFHILHQNNISTFFSNTYVGCGQKSL